MGRFKKLNPKYYLLLITAPLIVFSCGTYKDYDKSTKSETPIALTCKENSPNFIFENNISIIQLEKEQLINAIRERLKNKKLCEQKKINYNNLIDNISKTDQNLFYFEKAFNPKDLMVDIPNNLLFDSTGYAPLDFYGRSVSANSCKNYVEPYGYIPHTDTINMVRIERFYDWLVSDLLREGKGKVFNKIENNYEKEIIYEVVSGFGFGGSSLLFSNKIYFIMFMYLVALLIPTMNVWIVQN